MSGYCFSRKVRLDMHSYFCRLVYKHLPISFIGRLLHVDNESGQFAVGRINDNRNFKALVDEMRDFYNSSKDSVMDKVSLRIFGLVFWPIDGKKGDIYWLVIGRKFFKEPFTNYVFRKSDFFTPPCWTIVHFLNIVFLHTVSFLRTLPSANVICK